MVLATVSLLRDALPHWLYVPIDWPFNTGVNGGYNLWSGIGPGIVWPIVYWRRHNCHVHRCWRLAWAVDQEHGHPVCRAHHPDHKLIQSPPRS